MYHSGGVLSLVCTSSLQNSAAMSLVQGEVPSSVEVVKPQSRRKPREFGVKCSGGGRGEGEMRKTSSTERKAEKRRIDRQRQTDKQIDRQTHKQTVNQWQGLHGSQRGGAR